MATVKSLTDRELLEELLRRHEISTKSVHNPEQWGEHQIVLEADHHTLIKGYSTFVVAFDFNSDGSLHDIGIWE